MNRKTLTLIALTWLALMALAFFVSRTQAGNCSYQSVCPSHGISASFTGKTRIVEKGCVYGQYRHGSCEHWNLCYCPGE